MVGIAHRTYSTTPTTTHRGLHWQRFLPLKKMPGGYCYLLHPEQVVKGASLGRSDGTRPGARDVTFPSSRSQLGMRAGDDGRRRRRSDEAGHSGCNFPLLSLPVREASRRRRSLETTERRHEAGRSGCSFPLLSLPVREASRRRRSLETTERRHEAGRSGCSFPLLSLPVRDASRRRR